MAHKINPFTSIIANISHSLRQSVTRYLEEDFFPDQVRFIWREVRLKVMVPVMRAAVVVSMIMSVMLVMEAVHMSAVSLGVKLLRRKPEKLYKWEPITGDVEMGSQAYPMVLVQIPMYNEREVERPLSSMVYFISCGSLPF